MPVPRRYRVALISTALTVTMTVAVVHAAPLDGYALTDPNTIGAGSPSITLSLPGEIASCPTIVESEGILAAAWYSEKDGTRSVAGSVSHDRGATWSTPDYLAQSGITPCYSGFTIIGDSGAFLGAWQTLAGQRGSFAVATLSGNGRWGEPEVLSGWTTDRRYIVAHDAGITALWEESRTTLVASNSVDGGETWAAPVVVGTGPSEWMSPLAVIEQNGELLAFWNEDFDESSPSPDALILARSVDGGLTWAPEEVVSELPESVTYLRVAQNSTSIIVGWDGAGGATAFTVSDDGGRSWATPAWVRPEGTEVNAVLAGGDTIIIASSDASLTQSIDGGATWSDHRYLRGEPSAIGWKGLYLDGDILYSLRDSYPDRITVTVSHDHGRSWSFEGELAADTQVSYQPQIVAVDEAVLAYWLERGETEGVLRVASVLETSTLAGRDRYETGLAISRMFDGFAGRTGSVVYLATGADFPDALVAATAAASRQGPLILTRYDGLDDSALAELRRLRPEKVIIVGGTRVVSARVESQAVSIVGASNVVRLGGVDRYETAKLVVADAFSDLTTLYIATGNGFPDALAASAAAASVGGAVMVTDGRSSSLGQHVEQLMTATDVERVIIAGGQSVVSSGIEAQLISRLGASHVTRLGGADRFATSVLLNASGGPYGSTVYFATGLSFADALGGAALAGATGSRLFTVPQNCVPASVLSQLVGARDVRLLGGPSTLGYEVLRLTPCSR